MSFYEATNMASISFNVETADNNQKEFVQDLSQYKFNDSQNKIIQDMSSNMERYNIALIVNEVLLVLISILTVIGIISSGKSSDKIQEWFIVVLLLTQVIVLFFIIRCTKKTALSFERIANDQTQDMENRENLVMLALGEMRNLYKLQRRIVVLILMLIPLKILIDLWDYSKN
ncbi:MAG TPA: hypothetical protein DD379_15455 [Cyanobacteria bacterium UBA11162]|nr:hypothetical protein [Cyanobacteria bacterium UBA11162]